MALNKYKLGDLIELSEEKNIDEKYLVEDVKGISNQKVFIETKADMTDVSLKPYLIVKPKFFTYVTITSRNGEKISLAYNSSKDTYIVSSSYVVFKVKDVKKLLPEFLFMFFKSAEFDRYARFNSWGSAREAFSWEDMCDIDFELPPIAIQQKYVDIYKAMVENQKVYESKLDDLKLVCDGYIEDLRKKMSCEKLEKHLTRINLKNTDFKVKKLIGVGINGFIPPKQAKDETNGHICYLVNKDDFVFAPPQLHQGSLDLYLGKDTLKCSDAYCVFHIKDETKLDKFYLKSYLKTKAFQHYAFYYRDGVREQFDFEQLKEAEIPIPDIKVQKSIAEVFKVLETRKEINEKLKNQIKDICPILIQGALKEGRNEE